MIRNARRAHEVDRVKVKFDPERDRTHQSFRDECDINQIIDLHARTGIVTHVARTKPQYGDAPDIDHFGAAVAQAEVRSAIENGWTAPEEAPDEQVPATEAERQEAALDADAASKAAENATEG